MKSHSITRRHMLRGLGVSLSLPFLDAMIPIGRSHEATAARTNHPRSPRSMTDSHFEAWPQSLRSAPRMICCYVPNGVNINEWVPSETGKGIQLSPSLDSLQSHQQDLTIISGLGHARAKGGHSGADTWLTGADLASEPGSDYTNSISVDQIVAEHHGKQTRFASLQLSDSSGTGSAGHSHTLSFDRNGTPLPAEASPKRLFERLFVPDSDSSRASTVQRYAEKRSILDQVLNEANSLRKQLGQGDQQKLDQYLNAVRETEQSVERLESWIDIPKAEVTDAGLELANQPHNAHDRPAWIDVMMQLSYLAFVTDTTRVITFEWSREAGGYGGGGENHHELSHHGGDPKMLEKLAQIDRFHVSKLANFLSLLDETADGDGRLLDQTMVLFGSGMNSGKGGEHSPDNLPLLLAGGRGLGIEHNQHLSFDPKAHPPMSNLLLSIAQAMRVDVESFSDSNSSLPGLSVS